MENNFQKNITYLLENKNITANKILEITGHNSPGLVSMWKSGERMIIAEDATKLANYLGCTIDDLLNKDIKEVLYANNNHYSELDILFDKHKDILTESDKNIIKTIIEERKREIDKEHGNIE